jgi:2-keto-4-pentenoate hydratase/2-oxohepta-3-ene-1,7-dioic acid hydratase in catechol pathway
MAKMARFEHKGRTVYGIVEGDEIHELQGGLFDAVAFSGTQFHRDEVKLLAPCIPPKILAVGLNYKSHLGERKPPDNPEIFYKPVTALQHPGEPIVISEDALDVHFEGELVVVIGKTVRNASRTEAAEAVFGVTCGNDVSDRNWQRGPGSDVQWWRSKGCDTFAPAGPAVVTGLNYSDLLLRTRVNGQVLQEQRTSDLIFDVPEVIRFISRYLTLTQGDLIYTGTPGNTQRMQPGDVVEVEIEGIGTLRNPVISVSRPA